MYNEYAKLRAAPAIRHAQIGSNNEKHQWYPTLNEDYYKRYRTLIRNLLFTPVDTSSPVDERLVTIPINALISVYLSLKSCRSWTTEDVLKNCIRRCGGLKTRTYPYRTHWVFECNQYAELQWKLYIPEIMFRYTAMTNSNKSLLRFILNTLSLKRK